MKQPVAEKPKAPAEKVTGPTGPPPAQKLQRKPLLVVLAVLLVSAGAVSGCGCGLPPPAVEVVSVRAGVQRGHLIAVTDLSVVRVAVDPSVRTVPSAELDGLVGRRAAADLTAGTLLSPAQVSDMPVPGPGSSVVGVPIAPGLMPSEPLLAGDLVRLVHTPGPQGELAGDPLTITARVLRVVAGDTQTVVDVVVSIDKAAPLAAMAATGRVAVVLDPRG
ncbi:MAG: hypothetical protein IPL43_00160 [Micropruina sp.]|nr:hypothetical protein [Micropruina sp.]